MNADFFLVCLPGFEDLTRDELRAWYPTLEGHPQVGGVSVACNLAVGLGFNRTLKIPTRVLLRAAEFRCRDFPKLFKTVSELDWGRLINVDARVTVHAASRSSRVKIKSRIEETVTKAWAAAQRKAKVESSQREVNLFVRFSDDQCTLSLDTSGESLHKRGARVFVGEAPLRETIAAALVRMTSRHSKVSPTEIVDPMVGSGTFLLEAATANSLVDRRDFAAFKVSAEIPPALSESSATNFYGIDRDESTLSAARENLRDVLSARVAKADIFAAEPLKRASGARWLFVNPPYGERLRIEGSSKHYYQRLFAAIERWAGPDLACVILPATAVHGKFALPGGWKVLEKRPFSNGGIAVVAFVFGRRA